MAIEELERLKGLLCRLSLRATSPDWCPMPAVRGFVALSCGRLSRASQLSFLPGLLPLRISDNVRILT